MTYAPPEPPSDGTPADGGRAATRRGMGCALEIVETLVLTVVIYLLIHNFIAQPFEVEQNSMLPNIEPTDYVLIDKVSSHFSDYRRGDIIVFNPPAGYEEGGVPFIKRIIGLPGDTVRLENGEVFVTPPGGFATKLDEPYVIKDASGKPAPTQPRDLAGTSEWTVPAGEYFVMGDNRPVSQDSRFFGPIARSTIIGRAWLRYFPLDRLGFLTRPAYAGLPDSAPSPTATGAFLPLPAFPGLLYGSSATIQPSIARP
jgi:signal peptidase I